MANCERCGTYMNPAEAMMGSVCGPCVSREHYKAVHGYYPRKNQSKASRSRRGM